MSALPYLPLYVADYMADTGHLTTTEHGAYLLLLMAMWRSGGTLPNDEVRLARISRLSLDKWRKIAPTILELLTVEGGALTQRRLLAEVRHAQCKVEKRRSAGSAGGKAKSLKMQEQALANATHLLKQNPAISESDTDKKDIPTSNEVGPDNPVVDPIEALAKQIEQDVADPVAAARQQLWAEGLPALIAMGVSEKQARPIIGRWLKDADDDALRVLGAIQRAREHAPMDPIPWITAGFAKIRAKREHANDRKAALADALGSGVRDILAEFAGYGAADPDERLPLALPGPA